MRDDLADLRVLLAEDDFLIGLDLRERLEALGAEVVAVTSAEELRRMALEGFDAAILDKTLSDGEILPQVDRFKEAGLGIVFHTGDDVAVLRERCPEAIVLGKPAGQHEIISALRRFAPAEAKSNP